MSDVPEAAPDEVRFALEWAADEGGGLAGELRVRNVSRRTVRVSNKPSLTPLGADGEPLGADTVVTLELRMPPYAQLEPGEEAVSRVGWSGWDGPPAGGEVLIGWSGGRARVRASGPAQPTASGPATNLWSSWFTTVPGGRP